MNANAEQNLRDEFEKWISGPPFERSIERWPDDPAKYAWPGNYKSMAVDLAWHAWHDSRELSVLGIVSEDDLDKLFWKFRNLCDRKPDREAFREVVIGYIGTLLQRKTSGIL